MQPFLPYLFLLLTLCRCSAFPAPPFPAIEQNLETLAVTFMTGRVSAADLAPLEQLRRLRALTLSASRQAEEGGEHCLAGFPDSLLKLKSLTSLAVCSQGAWLHCFAAGCTGAAADAAAAAQSHTHVGGWPTTHPPTYSTPCCYLLPASCHHLQG